MKLNLKNYLFYLSAIIAFFQPLSMLHSQYPTSLSMLIVNEKKYYFKQTGKLYTGAIIEMSKKTWNKILEANLTDGIINGAYKEWYPSGVLKEKGNFVNGKREGLFSSWHPNGKKKQELTYSNDVLDSISFAYFKNGMIKKEHNQDTDIAFHWEYSDSPKTLSKYTKQFGKLNGDYSKWDEFGRKIEEGYYDNDKKNGLWSYFDKKGIIHKSGNFVENRKDGLWKIFDEFGRASIENYYDYGSLDSIKYIVFYMSGEKYVVKTYDLHKNKNIIITYTYKGNKISKTNYSSGLLTGYSERWFDNGQKEYQVEFLNNQLHGTSKYWRSDGIKMKEGRFENGVEVGNSIYFDENGLKMNN